MSCEPDVRKPICLTFWVVYREGVCPSLRASVHSMVTMQRMPTHQQAACQLCLCREPSQPPEPSGWNVPFFLAMHTVSGWVLRAAGVGSRLVLARPDTLPKKAMA